MTSQQHRRHEGTDLSMSELHVQVVRASPRLTVLCCDGEIDLMNAPTLRHWIAWLGTERTVVDLVVVGFLSVSGARELQRAQTELRERGCLLYMVVPEDGAVYRMLAIVGGFTILSPRDRGGMLAGAPPPLPR